MANKEKKTALVLRLQYNSNMLTTFRVASKPRILTLEGHGTVKFFQYCIRHNAHPISLPSHSTHLLQPLNVSPFRLLQKAGWGNNAVREGNFRERVLADPRFLALRGFTVHDGGTGYSGENIDETFGSTRIHPLNSHGVEAAKHETSLAQMVVRLLLSHPQPPKLSAASSDIRCRW